MREGPNVDIVMNAHDLQFRTRVDCVVCCDMLEHDDAPWETAKEIHRVLKPGGAVIVTVPGIGFKRHDFPSDYWRFTAAGLKALIQRLHDRGSCRGLHGACGVRGGIPEVTPAHCTS
jgi:predicted SAM-dependent methyltransferase